MLSSTSAAFCCVLWSVAPRLLIDLPNALVLLGAGVGDFTNQIGHLANLVHHVLHGGARSTDQIAVRIDLSTLSLMRVLISRAALHCAESERSGPHQPLQQSHGLCSPAQAASSSSVQRQNIGLEGNAIDDPMMSEIFGWMTDVAFMVSTYLPPPATSGRDFRRCAGS